MMGPEIEKTETGKTFNNTLGPLWAWAQRHPGTLVVGALLVAALLAAPAARKGAPQVDVSAEDVPLFI